MADIFLANTERMLERIDACARTDQFALMDAILNELIQYLSAAPSDSYATRLAHIRLQQIIARTTTARARSSLELAALRHSRTYLGSAPKGANTVVFSA